MASPKDAVAGLQEGGTTGSTRLPDGFHNIRLVATKPAGPVALTDDRPGMVVELRGIEPLTSSLRTRRSPN